MRLAALAAAVDAFLTGDIARWLLFALAFTLVAMDAWLLDRSR